MLNIDAQVLRGRYRLTQRLRDGHDHEVWKAVDEYEGPFLIKAWPFSGERPDDVQRALWDVELRNLLRVASSPRAESSLVVLRDAGVDPATRHFVMALSAKGFTPLEAVFQNRARYDWLRDLRQSSVRAGLWRGVRILAQGLMQLHQQQMLHRAILASSVFVDPDEGPETMRLGGFEWSVRVGSPASATLPLLPPELAELGGAAGYSFEADWFLFGVLAAAILARTDPDRNVRSKDRLAHMLSRIDAQTDLFDVEKNLLQRLMTFDPSARLARGAEIMEAIDDVLAVVDEPARLKANSYLALIALLGPQRELTAAIIEQDPSTSSIATEAQRAFIEADLKHARLVRREGGSREAYVLVGDRLSYYVTEHSQGEGAGGGLWDLAFCSGPAQLRYSGGKEDQIELNRLPIKVFTPVALHRDEAIVRSGAVSWKPYLPKGDRSGAIREHLQRFHDFFRITNQLELIFRDAEIFRYEVLSVAQRGTEVRIRESERERRPANFAAVEGGLGAFLKRQIAEKRDGDLVYLGPEETLLLNSHVDLPEFWHVDPNIDDSGVTLRRAPGAKTPTPAVGSFGFLRTFEMFGQISLMKRRGRAIDRLQNHAYLLQAILTPDFLYVDSGAELPLPIDPAKIDEAKSSAMRKIWRTRPIFALQGPPGTGKTTLVANLLGHIFKDDPVAQVLVSAQAHAAVDVLRDKVSHEIFPGLTEDERPLEIRLQRSAKDDRPDPGYVVPVTRNMLERAEQRLVAMPALEPVQTRWLDTIRESVAALDRKDSEGNAKDLVELVRRSASITYCTTTAGDLAELADSTQSFDWSLIEEAGKAHGFDLVLPLQTGHRWLLIGDQNQLSPYRYNDFERALRDPDKMIDALSNLPGRAGGLVDSEFVNRWSTYPAEEQAARRDLWKRWLRLFANLYDTATARTGRGADTTDQPALAEMLWQQHRMHPTIATLVSRAYYADAIESKTVESDNVTPVARVVHPFQSPRGVAGNAIIWLDVPSVVDGGRGEVGPDQGKGRYTAPEEAEAIVRLLRALKPREPLDRSLSLAVLSPYRLQVQALSGPLEGLYRQPPDWLAPRVSDSRKAFTVDSFQGDQADIVVVSLVRNNRKTPGRGLGFLNEAPRMNVLFSRAERLLVLVGSWDFFRAQVQDVPPDAQQPLGHWRIALDYVAHCFGDGRALRLPIGSLGEVSQ
jgi:hypothetical protein